MQILPCPKCQSNVERFLPTVDRTRLTREQQDFIRANYTKMIYSDLAKAIGRPEHSVNNFLNSRGLRLPKKEFDRRQEISRFKKGQISWNKGIKHYMGANSTSFKKGNKPHNTKTDGTVSLRYHKRERCNYLFIRISEANWEPLHRHNWKIAHGPIPKNFVIRFKDGDTLNCNIENLELVSMRDNLLRNSPEVRKDLVIHSDRYIAARMNIKGKKNQDEFIKQHPELIELKRQQLLLQRGIYERKVRRAS